MAGAVEKRGGRGLSGFDKALVVAGVVGGVLVVLWIVQAVVGVALFVFKIAVIVVVVAVAMRIVHLFTRSHD